jgi:hypothetical protein
MTRRSLEPTRTSETFNTFDVAEHQHRPAQSLDIVENILRDIRGFLAAQLINHDEHKTAYTIFHMLDLLFNEGDILVLFSRWLFHDIHEQSYLVCRHQKKC